MTKLHVYNYMLIDPSFNVGNTQRQLSVYAACETQKRAAELFGVTSADMRTYGGIGGLKAVQAMCHAEPDQVFVEIGHGRFARMQDMGDQSKWFDVDLHDEDLHGRDTIHPAFGQIDVHRIHGSKRLFAVDYPQDHFIRLTVHTTKLNRNLASDRTFSEREVIVVDMSEVQWARLIASPNTSGVACTLARYRDPETGEYLTPQLPEKDFADADTFKNEIKDRAKKAVVEVEAAYDKLAELLQGGPLRKGDLHEVLEMLRSGSQSLASNLPYVVERAGETIDTATENAKTEVGAFVDFAMLKLGERALGDKVREALAAGTDLRAIGRQVADAVTSVPEIEYKPQDED
jgi:hypothetical protein